MEHTITFTIPPPSENPETQKFLKAMCNARPHVLSLEEKICYTCGTSLDKCTLVKLNYPA